MSSNLHSPSGYELPSGFENKVTFIFAIVINVIFTTACILVGEIFLAVLLTVIGTIPLFLGLFLK